LVNVSSLSGTPLPLCPTSGLPFQIIRAPVKLAAGGIQLPGPTVIDLNFSGFDQGDAIGISPWVSAYGFQPLWPPAGIDPSTLSQNNCPFYVNNQPHDDFSSVIITFQPSGAIDAVWCWVNSTSVVAPHSNPIPFPVRPLTPVHLLVGRREVLPLPFSPPAPYGPPTNTNPNADPNFKPYLNWQDLGTFWVSINQQTGLVTTVENNATTISPNPNVSNAYTGVFSDLMQARQLALESQRMGGR
jgi:hypothetical protein